MYSSRFAALVPWADGFLMEAGIGHQLENPASIWEALVNTGGRTDGSVVAVVSASAVMALVFDTKATTDTILCRPPAAALIQPEQ